MHGRHAQGKTKECGILKYLDVATIVTHCGKKQKSNERNTLNISRTPWPSSTEWWSA